MNKQQKQDVTTTTTSDYKGLPQLLHGVRWTQHLLAIIAEILILLSFAMSGMDANLGGIITAIPWLKWLWAAMFALGIDAMFVISWVRVRQCVVTHKWGGLVWNGLLAIGMSFIVFQPVAIQLLQQSLAISFDLALAQLGINIVILTYARALVAVFLGAVLALSNVETAMVDNSHEVSTHPKRRVAIFDKILDKVAPVVEDQEEQKTDNPELNSQQAAMENEPKEAAHVDTDESPEEDTFVDTPEDSEVDTDEHTIVDIQEYRSGQLEDTTVDNGVSTKVSPKVSTKPSPKVSTNNGRGTAQQKALRILEKNPGIGAGELAKKAGISRSYANKILAEAK